MHAVKLGDVTVAVVCGAVKLDHDVAAFIVLETAERLRVIGGGLADASSVTIDTEGNVALNDPPTRDEIASTRALRLLLDSLLQHTGSSTAKLRLCACRPEDTGLALLVRELEGSLSTFDRPLDRKAMRATVAALARATWEAVADGAFVPDDAPAAMDWTGAVADEVQPISYAVTVVRAPTTASSETATTKKNEVDVPITQTLAQSPRPTSALPASFTETLNQSPRPKETAKIAVESSISREVVDSDDVSTLRAEVTRLSAALSDAITDRDRRLAAMEKDRDRRIGAVALDRARRVQEAEQERDQRVHDAEHERDRRVREVEQEIAKKVSAVEADRDRRLLAKERALEATDAKHAAALAELRDERDRERAESDSLRDRQVDEAAAKVRAAAESARDRTIAELRATHVAALLALRTEHEMERKSLKERIDELEYGLARANAERDAERTLRVDGEVAAANRYRELRRSAPDRAPTEESRAIGYRDLAPPPDTDRKWWK